MDLHQDQEKVSLVTVKELKNRKQLFPNAFYVYIAIAVFKSCCWERKHFISIDRTNVFVMYY